MTPGHCLRHGTKVEPGYAGRRGSVAVAATTPETTATTAGATTTTAAAESTTTAAATTRTTTATATTEAAATGLLGTRFVHRQVAAVKTLAVEGRNGGLRLLIRTHFDKAETLGAAGFAVHDHLGRSHGAELAKNLFQTTLIHAVGQIAHVKLSTQLTRSMK